MPVIPQPWSINPVEEGPVRLTSEWAVCSDQAGIGPARRFVADAGREAGVAFALAEVGAPTDGPAITIGVSDGVPVPDVTPVGLSPTGAELDERYRLVVRGDGVSLEARAVEGVLRGLATLRQLLAAAPREGDARLLRPVEIVDAPRIAWRGLSLDVVRCFFDVDQVRRVIDLLELYKLNVLHLHLTDDQGWRLEVPGRPQLTAVGGAGALGDRPGGSYTRAELADLVRYAADRGVTVVPEVDMPGHSAAAIRSYPELAAALADPASPVGTNLLLPEHEGVLDFAADVVRALADVAPGPYVHVGGDEAFGMDPDAYERFLDAVRPMVAAAGKRMITWQEGARSDVQPGDVVQYWMTFGNTAVPAEFEPVISEMMRAGEADLGRALDRGAKVILSPVSHLYLDKPYAEPPVDPAQTDLSGRLGLRVYPPATVEESFEWDPEMAISGGLDAVAGIEAAVWGETITAGDELEFLLLPRLPGVAERAWSPALTEWAGYRNRLGAQASLWRARGWTWFTSSLVDWA
jgi:hexosaminidase